ncbi:DUF418 domain-containing protein [Sphingomonas sp. R86520]|uniref:DUF418 domain-containing protein n=1 Tax=Sphingomonas sp. R86520 TaxID=3093859 RepID=UPI0036D26368
MTPAPSRIATLDLIRGVAVMGILAANIAAFGFPDFAYMSPASMGTPSLADTIAWTTNFIVIDGKMRGLFSFLFGASMLLVIDGARAQGDSAASVHFPRMAWLLVFGAIHIYLIWWGDILLHYALVGCAAFLFHRLPTRALILVGLMLVVLQVIEGVILAGYAFELRAAAFAPNASAKAVTSWQTFAATFGGPTPHEITRQIAIGRGGYAGQLAQRWENPVGPFAVIAMVGAETLGYMLLGMAGLRSGFLTGAWSRRTYRWIAIVCVGIGGIAYAFIAAVEIGHNFDPRYVLFSWITLSTPVRPIMIVGYAALIILLGRPGGWLTTRVAAAGRMAFSNYIGTSLVCTTMFYGFGFDLFGYLTRAQLYIVVVLVWIAMLAWSKPWLDRYRYGPLEWVWRSLSRFAWQPMRGSAFATNR